MTMDPITITHHQQILLSVIDNDPQLGKLDGIELATVLNSAASTVTHTLHGQALRVAMAQALHEVFKPGDAS